MNPTRKIVRLAVEIQISTEDPILIKREPTQRDYNEAILRRAESLIRPIKEVATAIETYYVKGVDVICDYQDVCPHCGWEWESRGDECPACCDKAVAQWNEEQAALSQKESPNG